METSLYLDFESALADIQLFGSAEQVRLAQAVAGAIAQRGGGELDSLLAVLRRDLRRELNLEWISEPPIYYRWDFSKSDGANKD